MTLAAAALALGLALGQHAAPPADHGAAPVAAPAATAPAADHGAAPAAAATADHGAAPAADHGAGHAAADAHGAPAAGGHGGGHEESLPAVMMHHVANGYEMELPGFCDGFHWNCKIDLKEATGGWTWKIGGLTLDMTPTKHTVMLWLSALLLTVVVLLAVRGKGVVPRGLYNFVELLVQFVRDIAISNIGKKDADRFVPYLCSAFFFILFANLLGLVPFMATATANISVTVAFALFTFVVTQYAAIRAQGIGGYLKHLTGGVPPSLAWLWPIMIPVEFLGLFTKPFALTVRLFANMVAGHFVILALLGLIFSISIFVAPVSVALALAIFMLELFVAFVQAYIFTMLSALFIGAGLAHHDEHHDDDHGHADHGEAHAASHAAGKAPGHG